MLPDMAKNPTMLRQISILNLNSHDTEGQKPILDRLPPCQTPTLYTKPHDYDNLFFCHRLCRIATKRRMAVSNKALAPPYSWLTVPALISVVSRSDLVLMKAANPSVAPPPACLPRVR